MEVALICNTWKKCGSLTRKYVYNAYPYLIEGSLEVFRSQTSYNMDRCSKQRWEELEEGQKKKIRKEKGRRKKINARTTVEKSRNTQCCWGSGGSKSKLAESGGCGAIWRDERSKIARCCGRSTF